MLLTKEYLVELIKEHVEDLALEHTSHTHIFIGDATFEDGTIVEDLGFWDDELLEAYYQGRKVTLNKPTRGDVKKFKVYVNSVRKTVKVESRPKRLTLETRI